MLQSDPVCIDLLSDEDVGGASGGKVPSPELAAAAAAAAAAGRAGGRPFRATRAATARGDTLEKFKVGVAHVYVPLPFPARPCHGKQLPCPARPGLAVRRRASSAGCPTRVAWALWSSPTWTCPAWTTRSS